MKNTKLILVTREVTEIVSITCDLCKRTVKKDSWGTSGGDNVAESTVSLKTGSWFPEGGSGDLVKFDICPSCFRDKLIPMLAQMGATPTKSEWD